jgi:hypothetical protein
LATKTLSVVTPRHSIKLNDRVVSVVPNAPRARADCEEHCVSFHRARSRGMILILTPAPRDFGAGAGAGAVDASVSLCRSTSTELGGFSMLVETS